MLTSKGSGLRRGLEECELRGRIRPCPASDKAPLSTKAPDFGGMGAGETLPLSQAEPGEMGMTPSPPPRLPIVYAAQAVPTPLACVSLLGGGSLFLPVESGKERNLPLRSGGAWPTMPQRAGRHWL